jgi:hypothetical protein
MACPAADLLRVDVQIQRDLELTLMSSLLGLDTTWPPYLVVPVSSARQQFSYAWRVLVVGFVAGHRVARAEVHRDQAILASVSAL